MGYGFCIQYVVFKTIIYFDKQSALSSCVVTWLCRLNIRPPKFPYHFTLEHKPNVFKILILGILLSLAYVLVQWKDSVEYEVSAADSGHTHK